MTDEQLTPLQLAKQGNPQAIASLINRSLKSKGITTKATLKKDCLEIMLESIQSPNQQILVAFIKKGVMSLGNATIKRLKIYGKCSGEDFPDWIEEIELDRENGQNPKLISISETSPLENKENKETRLFKTNLIYEVLEQFLNLKARTSIGISYQELPSVLGIVKLAVQKFERSPDSQVFPYLTDLIKKIMIYYELSLECLGKKIKRTSFASAVFIGLGSLTGITKDEPLGKMMQQDFPNIPPSSITGFYGFDTVVSTLWIKAGELTDELNDILSKPIDLETFNTLKLETDKQKIISFQQLPKIETSPTNISTKVIIGIRTKVIIGIGLIVIGNTVYDQFLGDTASTRNLNKKLEQIDREERREKIKILTEAESNGYISDDGKKELAKLREEEKND